MTAGRLKLADIFQDSMVLQRDKKICIWGECPPGTALKVRLGKSGVCCVAKKATFCVELPPMPAARGLVLSVTANEGSGQVDCKNASAGGENIPAGQEADEAIVLRDISIGDVYLAAGQSNMEFFLRYEAHFDELRQEPENPDIHMYNVPRIAYEGQERKLPDSGYWFTKSSRAWRTFSSIGYIFAKHIQKATGVPIGIIGCSWGGTPAAAWISEEYLRKPPLTVFREEYERAMEGKGEEELEKESKEGWDFEDSYRHQLERRAVMYGLTWEEQEEWMREHENEPVIPMGPYHFQRPAGLYHNMVSKTAPYTIKGVLWYQGENDDVHGDIYDQTFRALTDCWRDAWEDPELPFFTVQLAPFGKCMKSNGELYPAVRESQEKAAKTIPGVYMTSIMDLGMYEDIHPKEKSEIGRRLALLAMEYLYHFPVQGECPEMEKILRCGSRVAILFKNVGDGLVMSGQSPKALEIRQDGKNIPILAVSLQRNGLILECGGFTDSEVLVEYAWSGYCEVNLHNSVGLPVKPFRRAAAEGEAEELCC